MPIGSSQVAPWARRSAALIGEPAAARPAHWRAASSPSYRSSKPAVARRSNDRASAGRRTSSPGCQRRACGRWTEAQPAPRSGRSSEAAKRSALDLDRVDVAVPGREAARRELDRRGQDRVARQPAMPRVGGAPGAHGAGRRDRARPDERQGRDAGARASAAASAAAGARPDPLSAVWRPVAASQMSQNASPPIPQPWGMTTPRTAFVAIAASTADPPARRTPSPAAVARWCGATTAPWRARARGAGTSGLSRDAVSIGPSLRRRRPGDGARRPAGCDACRWHPRRYA